MLDPAAIIYHVPSLPEDTTTATLCGLLFGTPFDGTTHRTAYAANPVDCPDCLRILQDESYVRTGDMDCEACGQPYRKHPLVTRWDSFDGQEMHLHRMCDGRLVKL
jgi:hypothetical protein